jgi:serine/threonine protein kinase
LRRNVCVFLTKHILFLFLSISSVAQQIVHGKPPPLRKSPITAHLSSSAIDVIDRLMQRDPRRRLTADQMLEHPWTRGITAKRDKIADSDKKLSMYRVFKSGIAEKVFKNVISWSDDQGNDDVSRRTSLIERSFQSFDSSAKGYLTRKDLQSVGPKTLIAEGDDQDSSRLSLSGFSDLLAENMQNR